MEEVKLRIERRRELILEQQRKLTKDDSSNISNNHQVQYSPLNKPEEQIVNSLAHLRSFAEKLNKDITQFQLDFQKNQYTERSKYEALRQVIHKRIQEDEEMGVLEIDLNDFMKDANENDLKFVYHKLKEMKHNCDEIINRKDVLINELTCHIREREEAYLKELKRHESQVDSLRKVIGDSISSMEREYGNQIILIENVYNEERNTIIDGYTKDLDSLLSETSKLAKHNIEVMLTGYEKKFDGMAKEYHELDEEFNTLKNKLLNDVSNLEAELSVSKCLYQVSIDQIGYNHEKLTSKNIETIGKIKKRKKCISKFKESLAKELESTRVSESQDLRKISAFENDCKRLENQYSNLVSKLNRLELIESQKYQAAMTMYKEEESSIIRHIHNARDSVAKALSLEKETIDQDQLPNLEKVLLKYHELLLEAIDRRKSVEGLKVDYRDLETKVHMATENDIQQSLVIRQL